MSTKVQSSMLDEYNNLKLLFDDFIILYQVGEFFEIIGDDALEVSKLLSINLTKRSDKHMCGFPFASLYKYASELLLLKKKVVTFVQDYNSGEDGNFRRKVGRIITPGTIFDHSYLGDKNESSVICAITKEGDNFFVAWVDAIVGSFFFTTVSDIVSQINSINPSEILVYFDIKDLPKECSTFFFSKPFFIKEHDKLEAKEELRSNFRSNKICATKEELEVCSHLLSFINFISSNSDFFCRTDFMVPKNIQSAKVMTIDKYTQKNLDLVFNKDKGLSLLKFINKSVTPAGYRVVQSRLSFPLISKDMIVKRLDIVEAFLQEKDLRFELRCLLGLLGDFERATFGVLNESSNLSYFIIIKRLLVIGKKIEDLLKNSKLGCYDFCNKLACVSSNLFELREFVVNTIADAIIEHASIKTIIKPLYNHRLSDAINIIAGEREAFNRLQKKYKGELNLKSLKIEKNTVLGYYIEVSNADSKVVLKDDSFEYAQSLSSSVRFKTQEIKNLERDILFNLSVVSGLESEIIAEIREKIKKYSKHLVLYIKIIAEIDADSSFAELASVEKYSKPKINSSGIIDLKGAFHPMLSKSLGSSFIKNNIFFDINGKYISILTAPNMSGKSTVLRQIALLSILVQAGSFAPADYANVCVFDRIFCRIGTSDDINSGHSTFMLEMLEVANIAAFATRNSLIIIDEVGRGTSNKEGIAIASSIIEYIHNQIGCISIIATHYFELINLQNHLSGVILNTIDSILENEKIKFLYKLKEGYRVESHAILTAKLAGMPKAIVNRAMEILEHSNKD